MTLPAAAARPWLNRQAAKAVALNARDVDDARLLLDVLGLVDGPEGCEITPDDHRAIDLSLLAACPGGPPAEAAAPSSPAGPVEAAVSDPDAVVEPLPRRRGRPPVPIEHGSDKGYRQHKSKKVPIPADDGCGCQAAHDATLKRHPQAAVSEAAPPTADSAEALAVAARIAREDEGLLARLDDGARPQAEERPELEAPAASVAIGRDLAVWLSEASTSPAAAVRRSASATLRLLEELLDALDELARAERAAARAASGAA